MSYFSDLYRLGWKKSSLGYSKFMRNELLTLSRKSAEKKVSIINESGVCFEKCEKGGVFTFLHFGNFFLSGAAICQILKAKYTAVASKENMEFMNEDEIIFWNSVYKKANKCYSKNLFFTSEYPKKMIHWILQGNFLGVAMDVAEHGKNNRRIPLRFLGQKIFLQNSAARLARLTGRPIYPMTNLYCPIRKKYKLFLGKPVQELNDNKTTQILLNDIEKRVKGKEYQFFHDIHETFTTNE